jgi:hypothetical protein
VKTIKRRITRRRRNTGIGIKKGEPKTTLMKEESPRVSWL